MSAKKSEEEVMFHNPNAEALKRRDARPDSQFSLYLTSILWIVGAGALWYYGDIWRVVTSDPRPNQGALFLAKASFTMLMSCIVYLVGYSVFISDLSSDYMVTAPRIIYTATACVALFFFTSIVAIWPVWGFVSIFIVVVNVIAFFLSGNLIPSCKKRRFRDSDE